MERRSGFWFALRVAMILVAVIQSWTASSWAAQFPSPSLSFPFLMGSICAVAIVALASFRRPPADEAHQAKLRLSWFHNPLSLREPLGLFDLAAYYFIALGIGLAAISLSASPRNWAWELPLSVGCGVWLGVRLAARLFRVPEASCVP